MPCIPQLSWTACDAAQYHIFYTAAAIALTVYVFSLVLQLFSVSKAMEHHRPSGYLVAQAIACIMGLLYQALMWNKELPNSPYILVTKYAFSMIPLMIPQLSYCYWKTNLLDYSNRWPFIIAVITNVVGGLVSIAGSYSNYYSFARVCMAVITATALYSFIATCYFYISNNVVGKVGKVIASLLLTLLVMGSNIAGMVLIEYSSGNIWWWMGYYSINVAVTTIMTSIVCHDYIRGISQFIPIDASISVIQPLLP